MTTHVDAGAAQPQWADEADLYPAPPVSGGQVLAVWADELVVVDGTPGEVRRFLQRCLAVVPDEDEGRVER